MNITRVWFLFVMVSVCTCVMGLPSGGRSGAGDGKGTPDGRQNRSGTTQKSTAPSSPKSPSTAHTKPPSREMQGRSSDAPKTLETPDRGASKPAGTPSAAQVKSRLSPQQQANVTQLQNDLNGIKQGSEVTPQQVDALKNSLMQMADGATKPDPAAVQKLSADLSAAMADGNINPREMAQLSNDIQTVMNSANIPMSEVNQAIADAQAILTASGVSQSDVQKIVSDLQAIAAEMQKVASSQAKPTPATQRQRPPR